MEITTKDILSKTWRLRQMCVLGLSVLFSCLLSTAICFELSLSQSYVFPTCEVLGKEFQKSRDVIESRDLVFRIIDVGCLRPGVSVEEVNNLFGTRYDPSKVVVFETLPNFLWSEGFRFYQFPKKKPLEQPWMRYWGFGMRYDRNGIVRSYEVYRGAY